MRGHINKIIEYRQTLIIFFLTGVMVGFIFFSTFHIPYVSKAAITFYPRVILPMVCDYSQKDSHILGLYIQSKKLFPNKINEKINLYVKSENDVIKIKTESYSIDFLKKANLFLQKNLQKDFNQKKLLKYPLNIKIIRNSGIRKDFGNITRQSFYSGLYFLFFGIFAVLFFDLDIKFWRINHKNEKFNRIVKDKLREELSFSRQAQTATNPKKELLEKDKHGFDKIKQKQGKKQDKQVSQPLPPENLPVFIEEAAEKKERLKKQVSVKEKPTVTEIKNVLEKLEYSEQFDKGALTEKLADKQSVARKHEIGHKGNNKNNHDAEDLISQGVGRPKRPSAFDVANGFAPSYDDKNNDEESDEKIKEKLNKLLKGEL